MILPLINACFDRPTVLTFLPLESVDIPAIVRQGHSVLFNDAVARQNSRKGMVWATVTFNSGGAF